MLDRLLEALPDGAAPTMHSDMGWQYQHESCASRLEEMCIRDRLAPFFVVMPLFIVLVAGRVADDQGNAASVGERPHGVAGVALLLSLIHI